MDDIDSIFSIETTEIQESIEEKPCSDDSYPLDTYSILSDGAALRQQSKNLNLLSKSDDDLAEKEDSTISSLEEMIHIEKAISPAAKKLKLFKEEKEYRMICDEMSDLNSFEPRVTIDSGYNETSETIDIIPPSSLLSSKVKLSSYYAQNHEDSVHSGLSITTFFGKQIFIPKKDGPSFPSLEKENHVKHKEIYGLLNSIQVQDYKNLFPKEQENQSMTMNGVEDGALWVNKYAPTKFTDLLSHDKVNLEVLKWLMDWKPVCFPSSTNSSYKKALPPEKRILLIVGRPGLGKTTLAHIAAQTCGYQAVEFNASENRAGSEIKNKINAALSMNSLIGKRNPNLVIIDEIDGVAAGEHSLIHWLVKLANARDSNTTKKNFEYEASKDFDVFSDHSDVDMEDELESDRLSKLAKSKKKIIMKELKRPIICICNDAYVPVLRPLKTSSLVLHLNRPTTLRLFQRLVEICQAEGLEYDPLALNRLIELSDGDLRECLNTLQFFSRKSRNEKFTLDSLLNCWIGVKDLTLGYYSIWHDIFISSSKQKSNTRKLTSLQFQLDKILKTANGYGSNDLEKIIEGCFENFLKFKGYDLHLSKICSVYDWLFWKDYLATFQLRNANYSVGALYMPFVFAIFHVLFASPLNAVNSTTFTYPKTSYEMTLKEKEHKDIIAQFRESLTPHSQQIYCSLTHFRCQFLPKIVTIITPCSSFQTANPHLLNDKDKAKLESLIERHIYFKLNYKMVRDESAPYNNHVFEFILNPPIDKLLLNERSKPPTALVKNSKESVLKQFINQCIEVSTIKKSNAVMPQHYTNELLTKTRDKGNMLIPIPGESKVKKDFFGREIVDPFSIITKSEIRHHEQNRSNLKALCYKYQDGYSNAVKKSVKMCQILALFNDS